MAAGPNEIDNLQTQINSLERNICPINYNNRVGYQYGGTGWYSLFTIPDRYSDTRPLYYEIYIGNTYNYTTTAIVNINLLKGYKSIILSKGISGPGELKGVFYKARVIAINSGNSLQVQVYTPISYYDTTPGANDVIIVRVFQKGYNLNVSSDLLSFYNKTDDLLNNDTLIKELSL